MSNKEWRFKPLKAGECSFEELKFPCWATPKIDGINGLKMAGESLSRTLKPYANTSLNEQIQGLLPDGLCYEVTVGDLPYGEDLCRNTTSFVNAINKTGEKVILSIFDFIGDASEDYIKSRKYLERLQDCMVSLTSLYPAHLWMDYEVGTGDAVDLGVYLEVNELFELRLLTPILIESQEEAELYYAACLDHGYEGAMYRQDVPYKCGRATAKSQEVIRFKPSHDTEAIVIDFEEAMENLNEAKVNALGHTERSSSKENKKPLGMLGAFICIDVKSGEEIKVGAGKLTHAERVQVWENQSDYLHNLLKYRSMSTGVKDKPRFPRFITWRDKGDLSEEDLAKVESIMLVLNKA